MKFNDVYNAIEGYDENQSPLSITSLSLKVYKKDMNIFVSTNEIATENAIIRLKPVENNMQVSLHFSSHLDSDLRLMWTLFKSYEAMLNSLTENSNDIPLLTLSIVPKKYNGEYFASAKVPLYCNLQSSAPGLQVDTISLVFNADDFGIYKTDEIDLNQLTSEVEREIMNEEYLEQVEEQKRLEREDYLERRNDMIKKKQRFQI